MLETKITDVMPDGTMTGMTLSVDGVISIDLKRSDPDELFKIEDVQINSDNEETLTKALNEINQSLQEHGVGAITVDNIAGYQSVLRI